MAPPTTAPSGFIESAFRRLVSSRAKVHKVERVGETFRLVTLVGEELQGRRWCPGDMIQLGFTGFQGRAYTPLSFDPSEGALSFMGQVHGDGVASEWLGSASAGGEVSFVGPRRSGLNLVDAPRPLFFFGDETSVGTAAALLAGADRAGDITLSLEVSAEAELDVRAVLERLELTPHVALFTRKPEDRHLERIKHEMMTVLHASADAHGILTGKASSIQYLYKAARRVEVPAKRITNVAYWAPGRKGFSGVQR